MLHHMKLQAEPFQKIRSGTKTVEMRLNDEKRQSIREGDEYGLGLTADIALAIYWYGKAAQNEVAEAQFALGRCYEYGRGVDRDSNIAYYWYKRASKNGHKEAKRRILTL